MRRRQPALVARIRDVGRDRIEAVLGGKEPGKGGLDGIEHARTFCPLEHRLLDATSMASGKARVCEIDHRTKPLKH